MILEKAWRLLFKLQMFKVWIDQDADVLDKDVVEEHDDDVDGGNDERSSFEHGPPTTTD